jgi:two-component system copper resistance phosphate regulon response regulator CusR
MRALIVEDDVKTADYLSKGLGEHGFVVDVATDGDEAVHMATSVTRQPIPFHLG